MHLERLSRGVAQRRAKQSEKQQEPVPIVRTEDAEDKPDPSTQHT
jgi:hypothetical protein